MKQTSHTTIKLVADEGKFLTQIQDTSIQNRVFGKVIWIGVNDKPENYKEISQDEYQEFQLELEDFYKTLEPDEQSTDTEYIKEEA